jgi:TonB family protein
MTMTQHSPRGLRLLLLCLVPAVLLPFAVTSQESEPKPLKKVIPSYPEVFKGRGIYGAVHVKVTVDTDGTVKSVEVLGGNPIFSEASTKAIKQWKFAAAGKERIANVTVEFECCYTVKTIP